MKNELKSSPRDVFLNLLVIITLYTSASSFLALLFQYINILIPTPLESRWDLFSYFSRARWAIAVLIVAFPIYALASRYLEKNYKREPEKRSLRIRKWLLYFTLFAAALIIMGDLISLIYNFLEGELTLRFILKILSILLVAGAIFFFYLLEIREQKTTRTIRYFIFSVISIVAITVIAGFFFVDSPREKRLRDLDERRMQDLQFIQAEIINHYLAKNILPETLGELRKDISIPTDPEIRMPYEYRILKENTFELCANFSLPSLPLVGTEKIAAPRGAYDPYGQYDVSYWDHGAGRTCFAKEIDKDFYRANFPL